MLGPEHDGIRGYIEPSSNEGLRFRIMPGPFVAQTTHTHRGRCRIISLMVRIMLHRIGSRTMTTRTAHWIND